MYHLKHGILREMLQSKFSLTGVTGISLPQHSMSISRHNLPTVFRIQFLITNESQVDLLQQIYKMHMNQDFNSYHNHNHNSHVNKNDYYQYLRIEDEYSQYPSTLQCFVNVIFELIKCDLTANVGNYVLNPSQYFLMKTHNRHSDIW